MITDNALVLRIPFMESENISKICNMHEIVAHHGISCERNSDNAYFMQFSFSIIVSLNSVIIRVLN